MNWAQFNQLAWDQLHELSARICTLWESVEKGAPIHVLGKRERARGRGAKASDIPAQSSGQNQVDGNRGRSPVEGAKGPGIPGQLLSETPLDEKRDRAPAHGDEGLGYPRPIFRQDLCRCG